MHSKCFIVEIQNTNQAYLLTREFEIFIFLCFIPTLTPNSSATFKKPCHKKIRQSAMRISPKILFLICPHLTYFKYLLYVGIFWRLRYMHP